MFQELLEGHWGGVEVTEGRGMSFSLESQVF